MRQLDSSVELVIGSISSCMLCEEEKIGWILRRNIININSLKISFRLLGVLVQLLSVMRVFVQHVIIINQKYTIYMYVDIYLSKLQLTSFTNLIIL